MHDTSVNTLCHAYWVLIHVVVLLPCGSTHLSAQASRISLFQHHLQNNWCLDSCSYLGMCCAMYDICNSLSAAASLRVAVITHSHVPSAAS